jgi:peroxiredoxin (alkyl hydroperoxide reductase subunit C)
LAAVAAVYSRLIELDTQVLGISTDSIYSHKVFRETSPLMQNVHYPLISDHNQSICRDYRVLDTKEGTAFRATVIINPEGIILAKLIYPKDVGRSAKEIVRMMEAIQFHRKTGLGAPADWQPGMQGIPRDLSKAGTY